MQVGGHARPALRIEKDLAGNADNAGIDALGVRQELPPHPRAAAVGRHQNVAFGGGAVLEMRANAAGRQFLVAHEALAEMHRVLEPAEQHPPQRDPAHRTMLGHAVIGRGILGHGALGNALRLGKVERQQRLHLLGDEADAVRWLAAGALEGIEQVWRQAFVQGAAAGRIDVHAIALQATRGRAVALVERDADAGFLQALRQGEAADAAADDDDMERRGLGVGDRLAARLCGHRITPAARSFIGHASLRSDRRVFPSRLRRDWLRGDQAGRLDVRT